jgi:hypothetical protein
MAATKRFTITLDPRLYGRLLKLTDRHRPRLPKRYVVELALERLFQAVDAGAVELGFEKDASTKA